jgi:hypothetical protein
MCVKTINQALLHSPAILPTSVWFAKGLMTAMDYMELERTRQCMLIVTLILVDIITRSLREYSRCRLTISTKQRILLTLKAIKSKMKFPSANPDTSSFQDKSSQFWQISTTTQWLLSKISCSWNTT